tara:strand:+ start:2504 stop:3250 length:747 start_codon:yes stop_codon:yes gene_type:complete
MSQQFNQNQQQFNQAQNQGYQNQGYQSQAGQMPLDDEDMEMNSTIQDDGQDFVLLQAGTYAFHVIDFEQGEYQDKKSNGKVRKRIIVHLQIDHDGVKHTIKDYLPLKRSMEWKFCQLFKGIGDRKKGDPLVMDWQSIRGKGGMVKIKVDSFKSSTDGSMKQSSKVDRFLDPSESSTTGPDATAGGSQVQAPSFQQPAQQQPAQQQPAQQQQQRPSFQPSSQLTVQGEVNGVPPQGTGAAGWNGQQSFS